MSGATATMSSSPSQQDDLTAILKRRRSSSIRKLSTVSINGMTRFWKTTSIFGNSPKFQVGPGLPFDEVRDHVLSLIEANSADVFEAEFDARDVQKAHHNNWFTQRFVIDRMDNVYIDREDMIEDAAQGVIECLRWRRDEGLNNLSSRDFPRELYEAGILVIGKDIQGNPIVYIRSGIVRRIPEWNELVKLFVSFCYEQVDNSLEGRNCGIVLDFNGCGITTFDLDFHIHVFELISKYYPMSCSFIYIHNVSWLMRPGISLLIRIMPTKYQRMVRFTNAQSLKDLLGEEYVPSFLGGKGKSDITLMSSSAPSIESVAERHRISKQSTEKMKDHLLAAKQSMLPATMATKIT